MKEKKEVKERSSRRERVLSISRLQQVITTFMIRSLHPKPKLFFDKIINNVQTSLPSIEKPHPKNN
ncbi:hypothetical protein CR513_58377, partial [Mucuna pruriens]